MLGALLYLRLTSFKNWLKVRVRRLRQPKYLVGAIVGFAYFYFFFFRGFGPRTPRVPNHIAPDQALQAMEAVHVQLPTDWLPTTTAFGAIALLIVITLMWVVPVQRAALGFTEAEIAFLFPAPITRRGLVHFRLLSSQFRSLIGAAVMMLFSNRWTIIGGNAVTHAIGWWFIFSALNLHFNGANFTLTRLADLGLGVWRRRGLVAVAVAAIVAATTWRLPTAGHAPAPGQNFNLVAMTQAAAEFTNTAPLAWLLWPFKIVIGPFLAPNAAQFFTTLGPALAIITLQYLWVVRSAVAFEDSSVDAAQKRGARIASWRAGGSRTRTPTKGRPGPFRLGAGSRPELAFFWKNLLSTWPYFTVRIWLASAAIIIVATSWLQTQPGGGAVAAGAGWMALMFAGYTVVVGPQFARQDIRSDLVNADILKTYPLAGWQIILGELLAPVAILTGLLWLALLTAVMTLHPGETGPAWLTLSLRLAGAAGVAVLIPALVMLQLLVPNAAALLFPGWFQATRTRGGGPEVVGQRMIFFFAQVLTMVIALLPAAALGAAIAAILNGIFHVWLGTAIAIATPVVIVILGGEIGCALWWLGRRFEKLDLSAELRS